MLMLKTIKRRRSKVRPFRVRGKAMVELRRFVFERDGYLCQHVIFRQTVMQKGKLVCIEHRCLAVVTWESGHLAHIKSRGSGGKDEAENLLTKCSTCHIVREHHEGNGGKIVPKK